MIVDWDEVEGERLEQGHLCGTWTDLGEAAGTERVGVTRIQVEPHRWSTPAHIELDEEEIYWVMGGSGLLWQDGATHEVRAGDCVVQPVATRVRTFRAGDEGLDLLCVRGTDEPDGDLPSAGEGAAYGRDARRLAGAAPVGA